MPQNNAEGFIRPLTVFGGIGGLIAGFTTKPLGDVRSAAVRETLARSLGYSPDLVRYPKQIHGTVIADVSRAGIPGELDRADGLVADPAHLPAVLLVVHVGDCVPVLIRDKKSGRIAAFHAGWKGTLGGIAAASVRAFVGMGSDPADLEVAIGPHIGPCCYSVPDDRARAFADRFGKGVVSGTGPCYLDLGAALVTDLSASGVKPESIDTSAGQCTYCTEGGRAYFSFRRDTAAQFGEIAGVIGYNTEYGRGTR
jgi:YfiH family protein